MNIAVQLKKILDNIYELVSNKLIDRLKDKYLLDEEDDENLENNYKEFKKIGFSEDLEQSINYFKIEYEIKEGKEYELFISDNKIINLNEKNECLYFITKESKEDFIKKITIEKRR